MITEFRLEKEEREHDHWRSHEDNRCRLCANSEEALEPLAKDCIPDLKNNKTSIVLVKRGEEIASQVRCRRISG